MQLQPHRRDSVHWNDGALAKQIGAARRDRKHPLHAAGTVLVCMRHQDAVVAFDWKTKKVLWTWGRGGLRPPAAPGRERAGAAGVALNAACILRRPMEGPIHAHAARRRG